jgi:hypothetical protein
MTNRRRRRELLVAPEGRIISSLFILLFRQKVTWKPSGTVEYIWQQDRVSGRITRLTGDRDQPNRRLQDVRTWPSNLTLSFIFGASRGDMLRMLMNTRR